MPSSARTVLASVIKSGISCNISIKSLLKGHDTSISGLYSVARSWIRHRCKHVLSFRNLRCLFHILFVRDLPWVESPIIECPIPARCCLTWCHRPVLGLANIIDALRPSRLPLSVDPSIDVGGKMQLEMKRTCVTESSITRPSRTAHEVNQLSFLLLIKVDVF